MSFAPFALVFYTRSRGSVAEPLQLSSVENELRNVSSREMESESKASDLEEKLTALVRNLRVISITWQGSVT